MTKIIGHRGAAGLAMENSPESIAAALQLALEAIEFDIRRTRDGMLVVAHDARTWRVANRNVRIAEVSLAELRKLTLKNGQAIPTLEETLTAVNGKKPIVIDIKDSGVADELLRILARFPKTQFSLTGRKYDEMSKVHAARPDIPFFVQHHFDPMEIIHTARRLGARGITLNMWLMNPLTYRLAKEQGLEVYVYTVNHPWLVRFFKRLYPEVAIFTNHPERFTIPLEISPNLALPKPKSRRR
jgi:glycerophosphoryl diester phosphodiesterase